MVEKRTATSKVTAMRGAKKRRRTAKHNGDVVGTSEDSQDSNLDDDDDNHHSNDDGGASLDAAETSTVACQNCRKRKSKCSKTQPCFQCVKLNVSCLYTDRGRPGMKIGAVEALANRLSNLEQMFLGQGLLFQSYLLGDQGQQSSGASSLAAQSSRLRETYLGSARAALKPARSPSTTRIANTDVATPDVSGISSRPTTVAIPQRTRLPPPQIVDGVVEWYFAQVHRWIPILDRQQFEENLRRQYNSRTSNIVLLAMLSIGLRLWQDPAADPYRAASAEHRSAVLLSGMESVSIETLQALAIVAFDIIGSGHGPSAWSVIGSMARTVEQIRLNAEEEASDADRSELPANEVLLRRIRFLRPSQNWVEEEERRRLFWSIFMMDRFCSVTTGWSNSLSILHCRRRLPCEGSLWRLRTLVHTPFFGDGVKAQFLSRDSSPRPPGSPQEGAHHQHNATSSEQDSSTDSIGGFAYCIEATETLNLVTKFLLQHSLAFKEQKEAQRWLMRFRDLDLRLIKWRFFLPEKWRDASAPNQDGILDPNLVLAHLTHNTAVIQLHQSVAFQPSQLRQFSVELPQASSLHSCLAAANEIGTIARHFLDQEAGIVSPQVAVCLFIAARSLLTHSKVCHVPVHSSFETLSAALQLVSERWVSPHRMVAREEADRPLPNLASRLSERLLVAKESLCTVGKVPPAMNIEQPVYSDHAARSRANSLGPELDPEARGQQFPQQAGSSVGRSNGNLHVPGQLDHPSFRAAEPDGSNGHPGLLDASSHTVGDAQMIDPDFTLFTLLPDFFDPVQAPLMSTAGPSDPTQKNEDRSERSLWQTAHSPGASLMHHHAPQLDRESCNGSNTESVSEVDDMLGMLLRNQSQLYGQDFRVSHFDSVLTGMRGAQHPQ